MGKNNNNNKLIDGGLLILRIGIGVMFIFHGWPKVCAGAQMWESLGKAVSSSLMMITMAVAATMHLKAGDGLQTAAHSIELGIVFFSLIFIGAGEFRLSGVFKKMQKKAPKKSG
ncbi:MAG: DoxX family membrane protein [Candidatus Omnitrophica bacterium]|nr:DoxX family membrane protein [Candidatus Omnitrophota bacterium]